MLLELDKTTCDRPRPTRRGRLLGDLGGTHARLAWQAGMGTPIECRQVLAARDFASPIELVQHYLAVYRLPAPEAICLGVASAVDGDFVQFTNSGWAFSIRALAEALGAASVCVVNDFEALASALSALTVQDRLHTGGGAVRPGKPLALLGAGTGLGVASVIPLRGGGEVIVPGEGGHVTLAARDSDDWQLLQILGRQFGHVSAERVLSGAGLSSLTSAFALLRGEPDPQLTPAEVIVAALAGADGGAGAGCAGLAVQAFVRFLGNVAGNLALTVGAQGGVYIGGGVVPRLQQIIDWGEFRAAFEAKGRFADYLRAIPSYLITADEPGLLGAAALLDARQTDGR